MTWPAHPDDVLDEHGVPHPSEETVRKVCVLLTRGLMRAWGLPTTRRTDADQ